jgi:EamA domain-containing membrane protein RarD
VIGVLFMGERMTGLQMAAFALALAGLLVATAPGRRSAATT